MGDTTGYNSKKYGIPFYGASWVPPSLLRSQDGAASADAAEAPPRDDGSPQPPSVGSENHVVLAGGGGEGRSGIPNALVISHFDSESNSLSDHPVEKLGTEDNLPYRMAVHPGGDGVVCSMQNGCRLFEWDVATSDDDDARRRLSLKPSKRVLDQLQNVGQQLAITFTNDGSVLAVGGEDGKLRVFKWPSMETLIDEANVHASVKDLDFSPDGKFLISVGSSGPGRVWDVASSKPIASLSKENDEKFGFCRFSLTSENNLFLYITATRERGGSIIKWNTSSWTRMSSKHIVKDPICAFDTSTDGKLVAIGTPEGDLHILNSTSMKPRMVVKKAHLGLVTALMFSQDSSALVSASLDASARVTQILEENKSGVNLWIILLVMLLAAALYYAKTSGLLP